MKTSTTIRFVLAAVFATLACAGLIAHLKMVASLCSIAWLLGMGHEDLTRPIPRNEWRLTFIGIGIFIAVMLALPFLHLPAEPNAVINTLSNPVIVAAAWMFWMWAIYRRWQREKLKGRHLAPTGTK